MKVGQCNARLTGEPVIRRAERSDDATLALTVTAAFDDDPMARFFVRTDARRGRCGPVSSGH